MQSPCAPAPPVPTADELIASRVAHLTAYQDAALGERYRVRLEAIRALGDEALTRSVATQYARLLAPKDEYEVARLYVESDFLNRLTEDFDGRPRLSFHLAPTLFARPGPDGRPKKISFGPWLLPVLGLLAQARRLRGTWLDPFRFGEDKTLDRKLLADYEADLDLILSRGTLEAKRQLAAWPGEVRGFGPVRRQAAMQVTAQRETARSALVA